MSTLSAPTQNAGSCRLAAALILVLAPVAALTACGQDEARSPLLPAHEEVALPGPSASDLEPLDAAWLVRKPFLSLVLAGGQLGKHKPCGCTAPQLGGVERLAALVDRLRKRASGHVAPVALGWTLKGSGEAQEEAKAAFIRQVFAELGFQALLLGQTDLGVPSMCQPHDDGTAVGRPAPPVNVMLVESSPAVDTQPLAEFRARTLRIRAASLIQPSKGEELSAEGLALQVQSSSAAFQNLQTSAETIWIVGAIFESDEELATLKAAMRHLAPAIIVDLVGYADVRKRDDVPLRSDMDPIVVSVEHKGMSVGVLDIYEDDEGEGWRASYRSVQLAPVFDDWKSASREAVRDLLGWYKEGVREQRYVNQFPTVPDDGAAYVGSAACARCHPAIFADWNATPHAHALQTLEKKDYHWDPECLRCHVVGWKRYQGQRIDTWMRTASSFQDPERTPALGGVGCENCHGPGSEHVQDPWSHELFFPTGPDRREVWRRRCQDCHDVENSHAFPSHFEARYFPGIDHHRVPADRRTLVPR